jgi:hypothetical protein
MDLKREGVEMDLMCVFKISESSNILFLVASIISSLVGECILEVAVILCLNYGVTLLFCY